MCTKEEVRQVVRSEAPARWPPILLNLFGAGILTAMSWLLYDSHQKDKTIADDKRTTAVALAILSGKVELLSTNLANIKEIAISRSDDRWTGRDAKARNLLVDERIRNTHHRHDMSQERQDRIDARIDKLEKIVKEHHDNRNL